MARSKAALRLATPEPYEREVELAGTSDTGTCHSIHALLSSDLDMHPDVARNVLDRYSVVGETVLDLWSHAGSIALESVVRGRSCISVSDNELSARIAEAKVQPADLAEVALLLQTICVRRPFDPRNFVKEFEPFFDQGTFCELWNIRAALNARCDRGSKFIAAVVLSILHGHTAGFLSAYTSPHESVSSEQQRRILAKRNITPDYRAVVPRILRRVASILRDGIPSTLSKAEQRQLFVAGDPRNLSSVKSASVDLAIASLLGIDKRSHWIRSWFLGVDAAPHDTYRALPFNADLANEVLLELARVVRPRKRAVLQLQCDQGEYPVWTPQLVQQIVTQELGRYWEVEGQILVKFAGSKKENCIKQMGGSADSHRRLIVLRRM